MNLNLETMSDSTKRQFILAFVGDYIGEGANRKVYAHAWDQTLVVKVESAAQSFSNITEWQVWNAVKDTEHAKWFAPCLHISNNGEVLIQRRTSPAAKYPDKIPSFFTDTKLTNFGVLVNGADYGATDGQFVCHDYGLHLMLEKGMTKRMKNANWWTL